MVGSGLPWRTPVHFLAVRVTVCDGHSQMTLAVSTFGGLLIGFSAVLYAILLVSLGITSIRKGHWVMFIVGVFVPLFWLIGAFMPPTRAETA